MAETLQEAMSALRKDGASAALKNAFVKATGLPEDRFAIVADSNIAIILAITPGNTQSIDLANRVSGILNDFAKSNKLPTEDNMLHISRGDLNNLSIGALERERPEMRKHQVLVEMSLTREQMADLMVALHKDAPGLKQQINQAIAQDQARKAVSELNPATAIAYSGEPTRGESVNPSGNSDGRSNAREV